MNPLSFKLFQTANQYANSRLRIEQAVARAAEVIENLQPESWPPTTNAWVGKVLTTHLQRETMIGDLTREGLELFPDRAIRHGVQNASRTLAQTVRDIMPQELVDDERAKFFAWVVALLQAATKVEHALVQCIPKQSPPRH